MIASKQIKGLLAGVAAMAVIGTAMAQGSPPNPAIKSAPIGAGQQSSQSTPMGVTGTPTGGSTAAGSTSGSPSMGATTGSSKMGSTSPSSGSSMGSSSTSADTSMTPTTSKRSKRMARADRN